MIFSKRSSVIFILLCVAAFTYRCAQILPLTGGKKDTQAPKLLSVVPENKSVKVSHRGTKIVFRFDEMIAAPTAPSKLLINPLTDETPDIIARGKTLTVEFSKPLKENTTYFLQFQGSVVDIHESNPAQLNYMFSTGPDIDSTYMAGKVINALTQKPAADVGVMLYQNLSDSAPNRLKPDYMTKTDAEGNYVLSAVKPGIYQAVTMLDKNKNMFYDPGEMFGFQEKPVRVNNDTVNFLISPTKAANIFVKKKNQPFYGLSRFVLNDTLSDVYVVPAKNFYGENISFETRTDTIEVYYKKLHDVNMELLIKKDKATIDTVTVSVPSSTKIDSSYIKGMGKMSVRTDKSAYGAKNEDVLLSFSLPVKNMITEKSLLLHDTVKESLVLTTENKNEDKTLVTTYLPQYKRRLTNTLIAQTTYTLMFLPQSIETFWGTFNKDTVKTVFKTFPADEIGNLMIKLVLKDSVKQFILQLLKENGAVVREFTGVNKKEIAVNYYNLPPGEYSMRLIEDRDENKKFTPSDFFKRLQPEPVWYYKKPLKVLSGWDVEAEWNMKNEEKR
ncbi:MAG: Ig-like domain-containing protein [Bacteroidia bacterium]